MPRDVEMPRYIGMPRDIEMRSSLTNELGTCLYSDVAGSNFSWATLSMFLIDTSSAQAPSVNELGSFSYPDHGQDAPRRRDAPRRWDAPIRREASRRRVAVFSDQTSSAHSPSTSTDELGSCSIGQRARLVLLPRPRPGCPETSGCPDSSESLETSSCGL